MRSSRNQMVKRILTNIVSEHKIFRLSYPSQNGFITSSKICKTKLYALIKYLKKDLIHSFFNNQNNCMSLFMSIA